MKYILFLLLILILSCNQNTSKITAEEKEIAKDLIQGAFDDLWAGVDSTKILDYHTEDFMILENGEIWDNDRIKKFMRKQLTNENRANRVNIMDYVSIEKYGPSIQIAYHNKAQFFKKDSLIGEGSWLESALAVKTKQGWKLKMMHSTWNKK